MTRVSSLVGFFKVKLFLTLTNNISKNKLFQTEKVTCYNSWFHDKSTKIIFMLLASMIIFLFAVKIENIWLWKSLDVLRCNILGRREYLGNSFLPETCEYFLDALSTLGRREYLGNSVLPETCEYFLDALSSEVWNLTNWSLYTLSKKTGFTGIY